MSSSTASTHVVLGIECGGTRSVALAADRSGTVHHAEFGPANLRLLSDQQLRRHLQTIARTMPKPAAIAIAMAGARTEQDRARIRRAAAKAWPRIPCAATNDLESALRATREHGHAESAACVLILSGTGSCCYGVSRSGKTAKIGGWGHILGDKGSSFELALRALKAVVYYLDRDSRWSPLGERILRALMLNEPNELIAWVQAASKTDIAALAVEVFEAWQRRDPIASDILKAAAHGLANDGVACAARLAKRRASVQFVLAGSVFTKQPRFAALVNRLLRKLWSKSRTVVLERESVWGAVEMARELIGTAGATAKTAIKPDPFVFTSVESLTGSPTEKRNPRSMHLDRMAVRDAIRLMLKEDARIPAALLREIDAIDEAVDLVSRALQNRGRLFYVGAGTSGRLGVLDASECPPTFQTRPEMVQGIIAGGQRALWQGVEGAEDDPAAGARAIEFRGVTAKDVVMGIAASGRTPFVWGALAEAKKRRAGTVLLCFNPNLKVPRQFRPDVMIAPDVGPEILTGSTRLKAGTATKLVLNILTTLSMVRLGKVMSNLMIDVKASNVKLRDRAARIVRELTGCKYEEALDALKASRWQIKAACRRLQRERAR